MRKVSPLGLSIIKILAVLFIAEAILFAGGKLISRRQSVVEPPHEVGDWMVNPGSPPISDYQRENPSQISVIYTNGDKSPVHLDVAALQSADGLRQPQKYMVDSDGRISPNYTRLMTHRNRNAYILSVLFGIDTTVISVHWCQKSGGLPHPMATDSPLDAMKAILSRGSRLYVCDAWVEARPTSGAEETAALQLIADALSDKIKAGR